MVGLPEAGALATLLDQGLGRLKDKGSVCCLVVDYQEEMAARLLRERGFATVAAYQLMVRQIAVRQRAPALAMAMP